MVGHKGSISPSKHHSLMPPPPCPSSKAIQCQSVVGQGALTEITRGVLVPRSSSCTEQMLLLQAQRRERQHWGLQGNSPGTEEQPRVPQGQSRRNSTGHSLAIASTRLSLLKLLSHHPRGGHSRAPTCSHRTEGAPSHSCLQSMGLAPAPSTKIKIFLMTSLRGLQGNRGSLFPGFKMFLQSSI